MVESLVKEALAEGHSAPEVLNGGLIAGMSIVGREFKARELWVPDVLLAARNMQRGIEILKPLFSKEGRDSKGKIILGTVKGDIHDIGKNIVLMFMEASGFEIVDLGVDVAPDHFVRMVKKEKPDLLLLSCLYTVTMYSMEDTLIALKKAGLKSKVKTLVGGAPITQEFASSIGADGFGIDAVDGVKKAKELLNRSTS